MAHPTRWTFNKVFCRRPSFDKNNQLVITFFEDPGFPKEIPKAILEMYQAPDLIFKYKDGGDNKNEFRRYFRDTYTNLKQIKKEDYTYNDQLIAITYSWENDYHEYVKGLDQLRDVPLGKLAGLNEEEIKIYERKQFDVSHQCGNKQSYLLGQLKEGSDSNQ